MKELRYLVTGGTGFIASHITRELIARGFKTYLIVRSRENLWRLNGIEKEKLTLYNVDLCEAEELQPVVAEINPDIIFHLAARVNPDRDKKLLQPVLENNFTGTLNLLQALDKINYELFINTGTCEEYGIGEAPFLESQREHPVSPYSLSKTCATYLCELFARIYHKPVVTLRPFLTYGPGQISNMLIPQLIRAGINNREVPLTAGEQSRDFIYVKDVVDGYLKVVEKRSKFNGYRIINIGSGQPIKIKEVVQTIASFFPDNKFKPGQLPYRRGEKMEFYADNHRIKDLGWKPQYSFYEGIEKTVSWWLNREGENCE